jgi:hypothetical protein
MLEFPELLVFLPDLPHGSGSEFDPSPDLPHNSGSGFEHLLFEDLVGLSDQSLGFGLLNEGESERE